MAYIEPNSDIYLLGRVPFDPTYENTMYFATPTDQYNYFRNSTDLKRLYLSDYSYIRKTRGQIKVELPMNTVCQYNYMMYKNISFEGKWFYAFIKNYEYVNNTTTIIYFDIDVIQTWLCDIDFNECLIEREHTDTDAVGDHIIEEGLDTGQYIYSGDSWHGDEPVIVMARTVQWDSTNNKYIPVSGHIEWGRDNQVPGCYYIACEYLIVDPEDNSQLTALNNIIEHMTAHNKVDAIVSIFMADKRAFTDDPQTGSPVGFDPIEIRQDIRNNEYYVGGHKVHNKKLLTYPYNFIEVSNRQGDSLEYRWEFFYAYSDVAYFERYGNRSLNPGVFLAPLYYKGLAENLEEIVTTNNYPQCAFNNDTFLAWLAQNRGAITSSLIGTTIQAGMAVISASGGNTGGGVSTGVGALTSTINLMGNMYDHSTKAPSNHGNGNGDLLYQSGNCGFQVARKHITDNYAERIDHFFDMYGYKVNRIGKPNLCVRPCYTYVKTVGCSLKALEVVGAVEREVPADDARFIESLFNKGIRFWTTTAVFGSYDWSRNNNAIIVQQGGQ